MGLLTAIQDEIPVRPSQHPAVIAANRLVNDLRVQVAEAELRFHELQQYAMVGDPVIRLEARANLDAAADAVLLKQAALAHAERDCTVAMEKADGPWQEFLRRQMQEEARIFCAALREAAQANQRFLHAYNALRDQGGLRNVEPLHVKQLERDAVAHRIEVIRRELMMEPE